jgi:uncharacterized protein (DUF1330 family)
MKSYLGLGLAMLAGAVLGAAAVNGLRAQGKSPGAYVIISYSDMGDAAAFKAAISNKAPAAIKKGGGHFIVGTNDIIPLRAANPPIKRFVILSFDSVQQAKTWYGSDDMKSVNEFNEAKTKGHSFIVAAPQ